MLWISDARKGNEHAFRFALSSTHQAFRPRFVCGLTFELSRPWRRGPLADESNMVLGSWRPVGLAGAGRLERRVRPQRVTLVMTLGQIAPWQ